MLRGCNRKFSVGSLKFVDLFMKETDFYLTSPVITENVFNFIYQMEITTYQIEILESTLNYIISLEINE